MKKSIIFFAALAALFSCAKENPVVETPAEETFSVELFASAPSGDADTKTTLVDGGVDADGKPIKFVHWSKGDEIKVLFFPGRHGNEVTGPSGVFSSHFDEESSASANFRIDNWSFGMDQSYVNGRLYSKGIAVYPSSANASSTKASGSYTSNVSDVSFTLPSEQKAIENNIESNLNFSYADVNLASFTNTINNPSHQTKLEFKNVCALIQLTMPAQMPKVTEIALTSNDKVALTGHGSMNYTTGLNQEVNGTVTVTDGGNVVLKNADGFKAGASYYAVVWPGAHNSGLTIEFMAEDGTVATKTTPAVTLTASKVKPYTFNKGLDFESAQIEEGDFIYANGTTGDDPTNAVAVVFYKGKPQDIDPTVPAEFSRGLAIGLESYNVTWSASQPSSDYDSSLKCSNSTQVSGLSIGGWEARNKWLVSNSTMTLYMSNYGRVPDGASPWYHGTHKEWSLIFASLNDINEKLTAVSGAQVLSNTSDSKGYWTPIYSGSSSVGPYVVYWNGQSAAYKGVRWFTYTGQCGGARPIFAF